MEDALTVLFWVGFLLVFIVLLGAIFGVVYFAVYYTTMLRLINTNPRKKYR
jgi:predicted membrane protein